MIKNQFVKDAVTKAFEEGAEYSDVFSLYGSISQEVVNATLRIIENKLEGLKFPKTIISRTKLIGVEVLENIYKHQSKGSEIPPYFQVVINNSGLSMYSGNPVSIDNYDLLSEKLALYETLSIEQLKELYLEKLGTDEISESGNAGLGLITILNRSNKNASHKLMKVSDSEYFFVLEIKVKNAVLVH